MSPAVLFADEPTGSLDSLAAENVLAQMLQLVREGGTTLVMITMTSVPRPMPTGR